jgi:ribosome-associated protein
MNPELIPTVPEPAPVIANPDTVGRVRAAVAAAEDRKAVDLKVLHLQQVSDFTDYFLICSGTNERQVQAIANAVEERLRANKVRPLHIEGFNRAQWVLLDYGDLVVHVFLEEPRRFYALERLWGDAPDVTAQFADAATAADAAITRE